MCTWHSSIELPLQKKMSSILDNYKAITFKQLRIIKLIFCGTPRTGKTTLRKQLLGEPVQKSTCQPSTEIVKICDPVFVERIVMTNEENNEWRWKTQKLDDIAKTLLQCLNNIQLQKREEKPEAGAAQPAPQTTMNHDQHVQIAQVNHQHALNEQVIGTMANTSDSPQYTTEDTAPMTVKQDEVHSLSTDVDIKKLFFEAVKSGQWEEVVKALDINKAMLMQVLDGGGQPSFQEILPLLINGPSVTVVMFKLTDDLEKKHDVHYQPEHGEKYTWQDTYVVRDFIFNAISSTVSFSDDINNTSGCKILLVGTHKDELNGSEEHIKDINKSLHGWLCKRTALKYIDVKKVENLVIGIDNFKQHDIITIRKKIEELVLQTPSQDIPAPWLVFDFVLHKYATSQKLRKVQEIQYREISRICGVKDDNELKDILKYLHYGAGTLLYFPDIPELNDCVITDFQLIFDSISKIIVDFFNPKSENGADLWGKNDLHNEGKLNRSCLKDIEGCLEVNELLTLMQHRHIISKIDETTLFMPSVLRKSPNNKSISSSSFLVMFELGYCPIGLFCAVTTSLISIHRWKVDSNALQYRDKISFYDESEINHITFSAFFNYYEIHLDSEADSSIRYVIYNIVHETFTTVCKDMMYPCPIYGFYCPIDCKSRGDVKYSQNDHPAKLLNGSVMKCYYTDAPSFLKEEHKSWLQQVMHFYKLKHLQ